MRRPAQADSEFLKVLDLQKHLGVYTTADVETLSAALHGYEMCELEQVCRDRIEAVGLSTDKHIRAADVQADRVSFLIVAYACCVNHGHWFVEKELNRFMCKVATLETHEKVGVLRLLHVDVQSMQTALQELQDLVVISRKLQRKQQTLSETQKQRGAFLQGVVRGFSTAVLDTTCEDITLEHWKSFHFVDFEHASRLVGLRAVFLHRGTAYMQDWQLAALIRNTYQDALATFVRACRTRFEAIGRCNTNYDFPQYATVLSIMHRMQFVVCPDVSRKGDLSVSTQNMRQVIAQFAPLCIIKLVQKLRSEHHLVDKERVTLRLWLRAIQVKLQVAIEWWQQHVPQEEDVRGPITQAYAKQYECVGCDKIRSHGLCPFQDADATITAWGRANVPNAAKDIEDIVASTVCPKQRCGKMFELRYSDGVSPAMQNPRNPASYFSKASCARITVGECVR